MGVGATGARAARQLASTDAVDTVVVADLDAATRRKVADLLGSRAEASDAVVPEADVVLLATPAGTQALPPPDQPLPADGDLLLVGDEDAEARFLARYRPTERHTGAWKRTEA